MIPENQKKDYPHFEITKVWEKIPVDSNVFHHHLVTKEVSDYIRSLENKIKELENGS